MYSAGAYVYMSVRCSGILKRNGEYFINRDLLLAGGGDGAHMLIVVVFCLLSPSVSKDYSIELRILVVRKTLRLV